MCVCQVSEESCRAQFLVPVTAQGKNRAQASLERAQNLNPMVKVHADSDRIEEKSDDFFLEFEAVSTKWKWLKRPLLRFLVWPLGVATNQCHGRRLPQSNWATRQTSAPSYGAPALVTYAQIPNLLMSEWSQTQPANSRSFFFFKFPHLLLLSISILFSLHLTHLMNITNARISIITR